MANSYTDLQSVERLLLLIGTIAKYPGVGRLEAASKDTQKSHDSLQELLEFTQKFAKDLNLKIPTWSKYTIQKDLKTLRNYGLLPKAPYKWGYYFGEGAMNYQELQIALNALQAQAKYQRDPNVDKVYQNLIRRFFGANPKDKDTYPIRTQLDRVIVHTDPEEMMASGQYRGTLFEKLDALEVAIIDGQALELYRARNPYNSNKVRYEKVYPLQLIYSDIAWYILFETCQDGHFSISRLDRFSDHLKGLNLDKRGMRSQRKRLETAHKLVEAGWGLNLGSKDSQRKEIADNLDLIEIKVRFFPEVIGFILEGEKRHPTQKIQKGKGQNGELSYVDYTVKLPERSIGEFCRWVYRFMGNAQFIYPENLAIQHQEFAHSIIQRYSPDK